MHTQALERAAPLEKGNPGRWTASGNLPALPPLSGFERASTPVQGLLLPGFARKAPTCLQGYLPHEPTHNTHTAARYSVQQSSVVALPPPGRTTLSTLQTRSTARPVGPLSVCRWLQAAGCRLVVRCNTAWPPIRLETSPFGLVSIASQQTRFPSSHSLHLKEPDPVLPQTDEIRSALVGSPSRVSVRASSPAANVYPCNLFSSPSRVPVNSGAPDPTARTGAPTDYVGLHSSLHSTITAPSISP